MNENIRALPPYEATCGDSETTQEFKDRIRSGREQVAQSPRDFVGHHKLGPFVSLLHDGL